MSHPVALRASPDPPPLSSFTPPPPPPPPNPTTQTLRIILHAEGPNSAYFRPREAIVSRMLKKEEDGVYVVLFHSIDTAVANSRSSLPPNEGKWVFVWVFVWVCV